MRISRGIPRPVLLVLAMLSPKWWVGPIIDEPKLERLIENVEETLQNI